MKTYSLTALMALALVAACATLPPDPTVLDNARSAIAQAEAAGANEYAPLELRFAHDRLVAAEQALGDDREDEARRLSDQAEIEAQLALARTRAALARAELARKEREIEQIRADLAEVFGEEVLDR
ncbi:MAG: DUF4398 domain-containing protein [Pseudomonadota bacterium]|nr:MAG: DUF4398 domain-containing protein [Pseudomonadota bacterium]